MDGLWTQSICINEREINYYDLIKPVAFREEPALAWGFISNRTANHLSVPCSTKHGLEQVKKYLVRDNCPF